MIDRVSQLINRRSFGAAGIALVMISCGVAGLGYVSGEAHSDPSASAPVDATTANQCIASASSESPELTVKSLYQAYMVVDCGPAPRTADTLFTKHLRVLLHAEERLHDGDEPSNFDRFVDGQDWRVTNLVTTRVGEEGGHVVVAAKFKNFDSDQMFTYELVMEDGCWRVNGAFVGDMRRRQSVWDVPDPVVDADVTGNQCPGPFLRVNMTDNRQLAARAMVPADPTTIAAHPEMASWYNLFCDKSGRPVVLQHFPYGKSELRVEYVYIGATKNLSTLFFENADGAVKTVQRIIRDAANRPQRVVGIDIADGSMKESDISYVGDSQFLRVRNARTSQPIFTSEKKFRENGDLKSQKVFYPKYWYEYFYDASTGKAFRVDKYEGNTRFSESHLFYDQFSNKTRQEMQCLTAACEPKDLRDDIDHTDKVHSTGTMNNGERREWRRTFDQSHRLARSELTVNGRYVVSFVVTRSGSTVSTKAYSPDGKLLFEYPDSEIDVISADGTPLDGNPYRKLVTGNAW